MSLNMYLQEMASNMVLSDAEKKQVSISLDTIKSRLDYQFGYDIREKKVFGSYSRETILPRKVDDNSDIDLMVVFDNASSYKPQAFLNRLKEFAERYYSTSIIHQSRPSIVIELQHIKFELTPAYNKYGTLYIPMDQSSWMMTDPEGFFETLQECNKLNGYRIKPVIRLLKYWNIVNNSRGIASFELEKTIANDMKYTGLFTTSYANYVKEGLEKIRYKTNIYNTNKAIESINKAIEYESKGMQYCADQEIKKVFPEL